MLFAILSTIRSLTFQIAGLSAADCRLIAAGVLGLAAENGTVAAPLAVLAAEVDQPADRVLAVLRALADAGLVVLSVPPLAGDVAEAWVVVWWAGFAGIGVTVNVYSAQAENGQAETGGGLSHAGARVMDGDRLFVCSDPPQDLDLDNIKTNKQTARARVRACEGGDGEAGRIVALLTDPAVTAGLLVRSSGAPVGCLSAEKAREIAGVVLRAGGSFDGVLANVCQWRREVEAGRVFAGNKALIARLERGFVGSITAADRALPWFAAHVPDAWALPFPAADTVNVYSDQAENGAAVEDGGGSVNVYSAPAEAPAVSWLAGLAGAAQVASLLADAEALPADDGDGWIVRVGQAGRGWAAWLQAKGARPVGRALAAWAGLGAQPVPVRFVEGGAVFGD